MNPTQYHHLAARTRPALSPRDLLTMAALGIGGESAEVLATITSDPANTRAKRIKELGDLCWYVALMADILDMEPTALWLPTYDPVVVIWYGAAIRVAIDAGVVVEAVKKNLYHDRPVAPIRDALPRLTSTIHWAAVSLDATLPEVWAVNVAKLRERHPDGFRTDYPPEI